MSKGEDKITRLLNHSTFEYVREFMFKDCKSIDHHPMRFDFAIFRQGKLVCLVEVDGEQHFYQVQKFQRTRRDFMKTQAHDRAKNSYALAHDIPLYRIPYWELDNINSVSDIVRDKFRVTDKYHNDNLNPPQ